MSVLRFVLGPYFMHKSKIMPFSKLERHKHSLFNPDRSLPTTGSALGSIWVNNRPVMNDISGFNG